MGMIVRVIVRRGGRRIACFRRRPSYSRSAPAAIVPTEPVASAVGTQVRQLEEEIRDSLPKEPASEPPRTMQRLARELVDRAAWWWLRIRWRLYARSWLLDFIVDQVSRCRELWRRLRLRMLIRSVQRQRWRVAAHALLRREGRLTSP